MEALGAAELGVPWGVLQKAGCQRCCRGMCSGSKCIYFQKFWGKMEVP